MQFCRYCGGNAPNVASFCGLCGQALIIIPTEGQTNISSHLRQDSSSLDDPTINNAPISVPRASEKEDHEKKRRTRTPIVPIPEQPATGDVPIVQGTPQVGSVPSVSATVASTTAKAGTGAVAKWLIVAASCAVVIAGSIKVLPIVLHGRNSNSPVVSTSPIGKHHTPTTVPMPPTQISCPPTGTARAAVTAPLVLGTHQNIVYVYNEGTQQAPTFGILKHYDVTTKQKTQIVALANTSISEAQLSPDGQWVLFVSQVSGQRALQMIRIDGQGLQTLHCAPSNQSIYGLSWSPDQQSVVIDEGVNIYNAQPRSTSPNTYLLKIVSGSLQLVLIQPVANPNNPYVNYIPSYWIDNSQLYLLEYTESGLDNPITGLDLLDTKKGANQHASDLLPVSKFSGGLFQSFALSPDRTNLFLTQCSCSFQSGTGPSSVTVQPAAGGTQKTIYSNQTAAITGVYPITNTSLLLLMENYANAIVNVDTSQNGVWEINTNGAGLTRLTTEHTTQNSEHTILNDELSSPWSNISRDGTMFAAEIVSRVDNNSSISYTSTLMYGSLSGNTPTQNFASAPATDLFTTPVTIVGWTTL